jgi:hypothetical protein
MTNNQNFDIFISSTKKFYDFSIKYKNQSLLMRVIGFLLFFNKDFMTKYITTIGNTIYFPSEEFVITKEQTSINILAHELVHVQQAKHYSKIIFSILYLFPQCLVVLSLLAPISLWFLFFLLFLLPFPAPWRTKFELEGYTMSLFVLNLNLQLRNVDSEKINEFLLEEAKNIDTKYFRESAYLFMWPFGILSRLKNNIKDIRDGVISKDEDIYNCIKQSYFLVS